MNIFNNHIKLYGVAGLLFLTLTIITVIMPALQNQKNNAPLPGSVALSGDALAGKNIYVAEGCVGCHTQQVRNVDMDKVFGSRPGIPADYANLKRMNVWQNTSTVMGTERTGPDLTSVGSRQSSRDWHLMHLFNPRSVINQSIMPSYQWLFEVKETLERSDVIVNMPADFLDGRTGKVVAKKEALQLFAYLLTLKQTSLPDGSSPRQFLYKRDELPSAAGVTRPAFDGKALYAANCQSCHQENGEGLKGAYPSLKGSPIVAAEDLELYVDIIMNGYDPRPEYAAMAAVGTNMAFTENEVAAIINYERSSWGNSGKRVEPEEIKKIMDVVRIKSSPK